MAAIAKPQEVSNSWDLGGESANTNTIDASACATADSDRPESVATTPSRVGGNETPLIRSRMERAPPPTGRDADSAGGWGDGNETSLIKSRTGRTPSLTGCGGDSTGGEVERTAGITDPGGDQQGRTLPSPRATDAAA